MTVAVRQMAIVPGPSITFNSPLFTFAVPWVIIVPQNGYQAAVLAIPTVSTLTAV